MSNTINIAPTWQGVLPALLELIKNDKVDTEGKQKAEQELKNMALAADIAGTTTVHGLIQMINEAEQFVSQFVDDETGKPKLPAYEGLNNLLQRMRATLAGETVKHEVLVYVDGGNIQGASATIPLTFTIYDKDCADTDDEYIEDNGTPEEWDKMIEERTAKGEIVGVY